LRIFKLLFKVVAVFLLQVVCTAHSKLSVDGQPRGGGKEYLAIIAKDGEKKGYFIRIVDKEVIRD
jgi:hypothetical protein